MDEAVIDDLKQFIVALFSQQTAEMATKADIAALDKRLSGRIDRLAERIDGLEEAITATVIPYIATVDEQVQNHDDRLVKLETKSA